MKKALAILGVLVLISVFLLGCLEEPKVEPLLVPQPTVEETECECRAWDNGLEKVPFFNGSCKEYEKNGKKGLVIPIFWITNPSRTLSDYSLRFLFAKCYTAKLYDETIGNRMFFVAPWDLDYEQYPAVFFSEKNQMIRDGVYSYALKLVDYDCVYPYPANIRISLYDDEDQWVSSLECMLYE